MISLGLDFSTNVLKFFEITGSGDGSEASMKDLNFFVNLGGAEGSEVSSTSTSMKDLWSLFTLGAGLG